MRDALAGLGRACPILIVDFVDRLETKYGILFHQYTAY
jgi:hypothetical protein